MAAKIKEMEKKVRTLEGDVNQAQEVRSEAEICIQGVLPFPFPPPQHQKKSSLNSFISACFRMFRLLSVPAEQQSLNAMSSKMNCLLLVPKRKYYPFPLFLPPLTLSHPSPSPLYLII